VGPFRTAFLILILTGSAARAEAIFLSCVGNATVNGEFGTYSHVVKIDLDKRTLEGFGSPYPISITDTLITSELKLD
jgi:hypothetical protein